MALLDALGLPSQTKAVILSCDGLGTSHAANTGTYQVLREGHATSAALVVPGPWSRHAAAEFRGEDIGIRLTLTSDYDLMPWAPVTHAPSLLGGDGGFPRSVPDAWEHADLDEVRRECRAQLERAVLWGFDITHISSHAGAFILRPEFFDVALDLAVEFDLPLRLGDPSTEHTAGFPVRGLAGEEGILTPDRVLIMAAASSEQEFREALSQVSEGVTELVLLPAVETAELQALTQDWQHREAHRRALWCDDTAALLANVGVTLIGYRDLREAQRRLRN